jgi:hypothetical protein
VVTAELNHPGFRERRLAEQGQIVFVAAEVRPSRPTAATARRRAAWRRAGARRAARWGAASATIGSSQHFIAFHNFFHFLQPLLAQRRAQQFHRGFALRRAQITPAQSVALINPDRKIRPFGFLVAVESETDFGARGVVERRQKGLSRRDSSTRDIAFFRGFSAQRRRRRRVDFSRLLLRRQPQHPPGGNQRE